jgi:CheY-like chemotaxis protein
MTSTDRGGGWLLLVEDSEYTRRALDLLLSESWHTVRCAADGWEALDLLARARPPDAVVLDLCMPGMDGRQLLRQLKADPALSGIPVVVVSGEPGALHETEQLGVAGCLTKPLVVEDLLLLLTRIRRSRRPPAAAFKSAGQPAQAALRDDAALIVQRRPSPMNGGTGAPGPLR